MNWGSPAFILTIIGLSYVAWIVNSWIRARHGYPIEDEWGGKSEKKDIDADRKIHLLTNENEKLTGKVSRLESRLAVLERIATDAHSGPARLADEIEELR